MSTDRRLIRPIIAAVVLLGSPRCAAAPAQRPFVVVLGIAQDGGVPQAGTRDPDAWKPERRRRVASLGLVDPKSHQRWLFEATPDLPSQLWTLDRIAPIPDRPPGLAGIFVTHAHIGHYTGLMFLGREAMNATQVPVYAMPRMQKFLETNGPWRQLLRLDNIAIRPLRDNVAVPINARLTITPFTVPHRDEYSETVGFVIRGPRRAVAFVPDIDKWAAWGEGRVERLIAEVDVAYLDGTFFADGEIPGRAMRDIPHPFITESLRRFGELAPVQRRRVRFIHLNRSNPALQASSPARQRIRDAGLRVAEVGERVRL